MSKLSAIQVRNTKPQKKPYKLPDGNGLYLHVAVSGKKTWRYRFRIAGKESTAVIGEYPLMSLEQVREERIKMRSLVKDGKNPTHVRREKKQLELEKAEATKELNKNTFEFVAMEWLDQQKERWSSDHAHGVLRSLKNNVFPRLGTVAVETITPPMILEIIRPIENRGSLGIASKVLQRINAIFRYAVQTGKATFNPASEMKGVLKSKKVTHRAALTIEELPKFLQKLSTGDLHVTTKLALKFTILTAARSGEVRGATWEEIDFEGKLWKIPAIKMKMNTAHDVPLSRQALAIIKQAEQLWGKKGFVFPGIRQGAKQLSENTLLYALYRLGYHSRATVHGFRATFSTVANESGFDVDVIEKALAHEERNKVRAAYHRSEYIEQRRKLMQWWANLLDQLLDETETVLLGKDS